MWGRFLSPCSWTCFFNWALCSYAAKGERVEGTAGSGWRALAFQSLDLYACLVPFGLASHFVKKHLGAILEVCCAAPICISFGAERTVLMWRLQRSDHPGSWRVRDACSGKQPKKSFVKCRLFSLALLTSLSYGSVWIACLWSTVLAMPQWRLKTKDQGLNAEWHS